jgi:pimeloyl-ACP methyl ester carboxylesterase
MAASFAVSKDGVLIAYDVTGTGPALILLHGGGQSRRIWHDAGYVARLRDHFTVITMDIRGSGESDKPTDAAFYGIDRLMDDILAVADCAHAERFSLWGYSYGGNVCRYLSRRSDRVTTTIIMGVGFGAAAPGRFRDYAVGLREKWMPVIEADRAGTLDVGSLSDEERALWQKGNIPLTVAQLIAILDWPPIEPADLRCPTLWVVGSANENAMPNAQEYQDTLPGTNVTLHVLPGLTHVEELTRIDDVLPPMLRFMSSS